MGKWRKRLDIATALNREDRSDSENGLAVVEILRGHPEFANARHGELIEELEDAAKAADDEGCAWFNACLAEVYDIADNERIWLGA